MVPVSDGDNVADNDSDGDNVTDSCNGNTTTDSNGDSVTDINGNTTTDSNGGSDGDNASSDGDSGYNGNRSNGPLASVGQPNVCTCILLYRVGNQKLHSVCIIDNNHKCNFWFPTLYTINNL